MVVHTFNPRAWKAEAGLSQSSRTAWSIQRNRVWGWGAREKTDALVCISNLSAPTTRRREENVLKRTGLTGIKKQDLHEAGSDS